MTVIPTTTPNAFIAIISASTSTTRASCIAIILACVEVVIVVIPFLSDCGRCLHESDLTVIVIIPVGATTAYPVDW